MRACGSVAHKGLLDVNLTDIGTAPKVAAHISVSFATHNLV